MSMKVLVALAALFFAAPVVAQLAPAGDYNFSYSAGLYSGSGTITTNGATATAISGTATDGTFTSAILGLSSFAAADNTLYLTDPYVTFAGLSFSTAFADFNLFNYVPSATDYALIDSRLNPQGFADPSTVAQVEVSAVPEPATWAMMLLGFGAVGVSVRRSRKTNKLPQAA